MAKKKNDDDLDALEEVDDLEDVEALEDAEDAEEPEKEEAEEPAEEEKSAAAPKPQVTVLTLVLCVLNVLAACGFAFLLIMDYGARQQAAYAVFRFDLALVGLPLQEEQDKITAEEAARNPVRIDSDQLKREFSNRRTRRSVKEPFQPVNEALGMQQIKPSQLSEGTLRDIFQGSGPPVRTLNEEVKRIQGQIFGDMKAAATNAAQKLKTPKTQRPQLRFLLMPFAYTTADLLALENQISLAQANPATYGKQLVEAGQRKMMIDLLRLLQSYRPSAAEEQFLRNAGNRNKVKLADLQKHVSDRFDQALAEKYSFGKDRESYEKRNTIGVLLVAVAHLKQPDFKTLLYPDGPKRAAAVLGLDNYNQSMADLAEALDRYRTGYEERLIAGRNGSAAEGKNDFLPGFATRHEEEIGRILEVVANIKSREQSLKQLEGLIQANEDLYAQRLSDYKAVVKQIVEIRAETAKLVVELRRLERQLFLAEKELASAGEINRQLEAQIRAAEKTVGEKSAP